MDDEAAPRRARRAAGRTSAASPPSTSRRPSRSARRGERPQRLRAWQAEALDRYFASTARTAWRGPRDFLAAATPGAGKTTFALRLASELLRRRIIDRIVVVAPDRAPEDAVGGCRGPRLASGSIPPSATATTRRRGTIHGVAVTYAQVAVKASVHQRLTEDAPHARDPRRGAPRRRRAQLGRRDPRGVRAAPRGACCSRARRSAATPRRSRSWSTTPTSTASALSRTDYDYGYGRALADGVVRPVIFLVYAGQMRWRTSAGDEMEAQLGQDNTKDITAQAWRTALDPEGEWIPAVLAVGGPAAHRGARAGSGCRRPRDRDRSDRRARLRRRSCAASPARSPPSCSPTRRRHRRGSRRSRTATSRWMVAVRMVSEGVDVPRLAVGVYATSRLDAAVLRAGDRPLRAGAAARRDGERVPAATCRSCWRWRASSSASATTRSTATATATTSGRSTKTCMDAAEREDNGLRRAHRGVHATRRSARWRTSTGCSSTARSSGSSPCRARPRRRSSSGFPGLLEPEHVHELLHAAAGAPGQAPPRARGARGGRRRRSPSAACRRRCTAR